jgi:hypothetical protein
MTFIVEWFDKEGREHAQFVEADTVGAAREICRKTNKRKFSKFKESKSCPQSKQ